ncbi:MAG: carbamoyltransferase C-terminal domain-containing protein, partial [Acidobacteriota bacterium]
MMNLKIKFRESFRPFAPSVTTEAAGEYFDLDAESPYMLLVAAVQPARRRTHRGPPGRGLERLREIRSEIPAVTHVDYSARVQTVAARDHPLYHRLLQRFAHRSGCPVLVNTSFNVRGEPMVCSPEDAYRCFTRTGMDFLVLGNYLIDRSKQTLPSLHRDTGKEIPLD